jgi:hypothetical protein
MKRSLSIRKRLEHLEAGCQVDTVAREAFIEICSEQSDSAERHVELLSNRSEPRWYFQEKPGPGLQLDDFGKFGLVLWLTYAEMNA